MLDVMVIVLTVYSNCHYHCHCHHYTHTTQQQCNHLVFSSTYHGCTCTIVYHPMFSKHTCLLQNLRYYEWTPVFWISFGLISLLIFAQYKITKIKSNYFSLGSVKSFFIILSICLHVLYCLLSYIRDVYFPFPKAVG